MSNGFKQVKWVKGVKRVKWIKQVHSVKWVNQVKEVKLLKQSDRVRKGRIGSNRTIQSERESYSVIGSHTEL